jgi:hypothetical protein
VLAKYLGSMQNRRNMSERIAFGLSGDSNSMLQMDIPPAVLARIQEDGRFRLPTSAKEMQRSPMLFEQLDGGVVRASVLNRRIGRLGDGSDKRLALTRVINLISWVDGFAEPSEQDEAIQIEVSSRPLQDGTRYGLDMEIAWPEADDSAAQDLATMAMRRAAVDLRYLRGDHRSRERQLRLVEQLVGASVARMGEHAGVSLIAHADGSCTADTDGSSYGYGMPKFGVYAHNLYSHEMQLLCITGGVAIACADQLIDTTGSPN